LFDLETVEGVFWLAVRRGPATNVEHRVGLRLNGSSV
jgi:hypothetical protein